MFFINMTNPLTLFLILAAIVLLIFLGKELKKSYVEAIPLAGALLLTVTHTIQLLTLPDEYINLASTVTFSIGIDLILVLITFFAYLWIDDVEAKAMNKKSLDNSLEWFWKKV